VYSGLRLADAGDPAAATTIYRFYVDRLDRRGTLAGAYTTAGAPSGPQDLACYALLARLALRLGDGDRAREIVERWLAPHRQADGPLAGLYTEDPDDASAFVNLEALLTLDELESRRAPAD